MEKEKQSQVSWLIERIEASADEASLLQCREDTEWLYSIDKDEEVYNHLINLIKEKHGVL